MAQWGGNLNYRPEKKAKKEREKARGEAVATRGETERATVATEFRVGKTIAGATNDARKRNLEHIAQRKKRAVRNAIITILILAAFIGLGILFTKQVEELARRREEALRAENPVEPTVTILDENVGNNISERTKTFVARLEADAKEYDLKIDHVVLPFQKAREIDVYIEKRSEYYKMTLERGSTVQIEDASRMIRYLDEKDLHPGYVDIRVEGKAFYK